MHGVNDLTSSSYESSYLLHKLRISDYSDFLQVPITLEGINRFANIDAGYDCDIHIVWQSNRQKNWNVYYANSTDIGVAFRQEYLISNTENNSLMPCVSINRNGRRMIAWHEKKFGKYAIYTARSLEGYIKSDRSVWEDIYGDIGKDAKTCYATFNYSVETAGTYQFVIEFYNNSDFTDLYMSVSTSSSTADWTIDGAEPSSDGEYLIAGSNIRIEYYLGGNNYLLDRLLYCKLVSYRG